MIETHFVFHFPFFYLTWFVLVDQMVVFCFSNENLLIFLGFTKWVLKVFGYVGLGMCLVLV